MTTREHVEPEITGSAGVPGGEPFPSHDRVLGTAHGHDGARQRLGHRRPVSGDDAQIGPQRPQDERAPFRVVAQVRGYPSELLLDLVEQGVVGAERQGRIRPVHVWCLVCGQVETPRQRPAAYPQRQGELVRDRGTEAVPEEVVRRYQVHLVGDRGDQGGHRRQRLLVDAPAVAGCLHTPDLRVG